MAAAGHPRPRKASSPGPGHLAGAASGPEAHASGDRNGLLSAQKAGLFIVGMLSYASLGFCVSLEQSYGHRKYSPLAITVLAELGKLLFTLVHLFLVSRQGQAGAPKQGGSLARLGRALVPTGLYAATNNIAQVSVLYADSASWQALCQNRILATAILWKWAFPTRKLDTRQWAAVVALCLGSAIVAFHQPDVALEDAFAYRRTRVTREAIPLVFLYISFSAVAGVYTEAVYKGMARRSNEWLLQDASCYGLGALLSHAAFASQRLRALRWRSAGALPRGALVWDVLEAANPAALFSDVTLLGWCTCLSLVFMGIAAGKIMAHFSNIHKLIMQAFSMYISVLLLSLAIGLRPPWTFFLGAATITAAVLLYNHKHFEEYFQGPGEAVRTAKKER